MEAVCSSWLWMRSGRKVGLDRPIEVGDVVSPWLQGVFLLVLCLTQTSTDPLVTQSCGSSIVHLHSSSFQQSSSLRPSFFKAYCLQSQLCIAHFRLSGWSQTILKLDFYSLKNWLHYVHLKSKRWGKEFSVSAPRTAHFFQIKLFLRDSYSSQKQKSILKSARVDYQQCL